MKKILISIAALLIIGVFYFSMQYNKWNRYYKKTLYRAPAAIIIEGAGLFESPGTALDIGCGVGNETAYLINKGWQVWAIDSDARAFTWLLSRNDLPKNASLHTITAPFETLDWEMLPAVDLVSASLSLPFCMPEKFSTVWSHLVSKIKQNGRFAGHFFGVDYKGFSEKEKERMTFLTRDKLINLFTSFEIEIIREQRDEVEKASATGASIRAHIFEVVARKK